MEDLTFFEGGAGMPRRWNAYALMGIVSIVFLMFVLAALFKAGGDNKESHERHWKRMEGFISTVEDLNWDIMYMGADLGTPESFHVRKIYGVGDISGGQAKKGANGKLIVINDPKGELNMSVEMWKELYTLWDEQGCRIAYLGTRQIDNMKEAGFPVDKSKKSFYYSPKASAPGFADDSQLVPFYVEQDISKDCVPVYTMICEIATKEIYQKDL